MATNLSSKFESATSYVAGFNQTSYLTNSFISGSFRNRCSGFATLIIMVLVLTLSGIGLEGFIKANAGIRMVKRQAQSHQAIYFAEGGIEWAKAQLLLNPNWQGGSKAIGEGQAKVSILANGGGYWVTSLATSGLAKREIKVYLYLNSGQWIISHYQELHL